jgi:hypothetical protein
MDADTRCELYGYRIAENIGRDLARKLLEYGCPPDVLFGEVLEACHYAGVVLDRVTRSVAEAEAADGDLDTARELLFAAEHFRRVMRDRLPDHLDLRTIPGDSPDGVEIIRRGESWDRRD